MTMPSSEVRSAVRRILAGTLAAFLGCVIAAPARASFQFSDWVTQNTSSATVAWHYSSGSATLTGSVPVNFRFDNIPSLPTGLQSATLTITASTNIAGTYLPGPNLITEPLSGSITITRTSDNANLLTIGFNGAITGVRNSSNATVAADVALVSDIVNFTSAFFTVSNGSGNSFQLGLPSVTPGLTLNGSNFINDFTSNVLGSASVTSVGSLDPVPEPGSLVSVCSGLTAVGTFLWVRRRRRAG